MKICRRFLIWIMATVTLAAAMALPVFALINTNDNRYLVTGATPSGKVGKTMTLNLTLRNDTGSDQDRMGVGVDPDVYFDEEGAVTEDRVSMIFPFEVNDKTFVPAYSKAKMNVGDERRLSLSVKVRKDIKEGYYTVRMAIYGGGDSEFPIDYEYINVWIGAATSSTEDDENNKTTDFILGEGQSTPTGVYPNVMNYAVNLRNNSHATAYDVKVSMVLDADEKIFPFEINDVNYDRMFDKIEVGQVVELPYSMAIRPDTYSNYYQIKLKVSYSPNSTGGDRREYETAYFVKITNKDEEDEKGEFNQNDRTRARIIVDSFETVPKDIIAGEEFDLICRIRNASKSISATNILFTMESEKVSESAIFTSLSGSMAIAVDTLPPDQLHEIRLRLVSKPGAEQRSYAMKIVTKYDSPEFKNAEENLAIDIPVKQTPRLNTSTFEIMPSSIVVGEETNVMFGINNTGKVILYNVMVNFKADSIQPLETYVGNIKPGDTGNVDCMLMGLAATADDGMVGVTVSYEDENGEVFTVDKEMQLYVGEAMAEEEDPMEVGLVLGEQTEGSFFTQHRWAILGGGAAVLVVALVAIVAWRRKKKKRALDEDVDDEIS